MIIKTISNSFVYKFVWIVKYNTIDNELNHKNILLKIVDKFYLFKANTSDFSDKQIQEIYDKQQIYINVKNLKTSYDFLTDYRKLKKNWDFFEIEKKNLFKVSEKKVRDILDNIFIWNCLDVWCWNTLYKDIFTKKEVNYLWIDIHTIDSDLNIYETSFEEFSSKEKFDTIFFFRSINHFRDTKLAIIKVISLLKENWKIFIVENEAFWEVKFKNQIFEWEVGDYEHYFNYSLAEFKKVVENLKFDIIYEEEVNKNNANQWYICLQKK